MDALIADKTAQNTAYSQEAAKLEADMAENQKGQGEATTTRGKEEEAFEKEEEDLVLSEVDHHAFANSDRKEAV